MKRRIVHLKNSESLCIAEDCSLFVFYESARIDLNITVKHDVRFKLIEILPNIGKIKRTLECGDSSTTQNIQVILGGNNNYSSHILLNKESNYFCNSLLCLHDSNSCEYAYLCEHKAQKSISDLLLTGFLNDKSRKNSSLTIDFKTGSSDSIGKESEDFLLLSNDATNIASPIVLCAEENVDGHHSIKSSHIGTETMNYLNTRGLSTDEIRRLICFGKVKFIVEKIPNRRIREDIYERLKDYEF